jgi:Uma2 family endonuclease
VRQVAQPQVTRRKFTVDEYHLLARAGILKEDDRVELIDGEIVEMSPIGSRHAACVDRLNRVFSRLGERAIVRVQSPVRLGDFAEPQPDLALLRPRSDATAHPTPEDVLLVVEVQKLDYDRQIRVEGLARGP